MRGSILAVVAGCCVLAVSGRLMSLAAAELSYAEAREHLVKRLEHQGISSREVLKSIARVPRHAFVPASLAAKAYENEALPITGGQTISQPYIVALMTELLRIKPGAKVLEVGTGSGYQAAVLSELGAKVYSVEVSPELARAARLRLATLGYHNIHVKVGDGFYGWPEQSPFDAVVVTAAAPEIPRHLVRQLVDGGIIVIPLDKGDGRQVLVQGIKSKGHLRTRQVTGVRFVPMTGAVRGKARSGGKPNAYRERGSGRPDHLPLPNLVPPAPAARATDHRDVGALRTAPAAGSAQEEGQHGK